MTSVINWSDLFLITKLYIVLQQSQHIINIIENEPRLNSYIVTPLRLLDLLGYKLNLKNLYI